MLGQALILTFLLLPRGAQSKECEVLPHPVVLGQSVQLKSNSIPSGLRSVVWRKNHSGVGHVLLSWKTDFKQISKNWSLSIQDSGFSSTDEDFALIIEKAQQEYNGLYEVEFTQNTGKVSRLCFWVSTHDPVEKPRLQAQSKVLDGRKCQVVLNCLVPGTGNVSYAWYRGSQQIQESGTSLEEQVAINSLLEYTCIVSNNVSWANTTLTLSCPNPSNPLGFNFLVLLVSIITIVLVVVVSIVCFCAWKRKQSEPRPQPLLTTYECVNTVKNRRNQKPEQRPPEENNTIYSVIQLQSPASTSQNEEKTLYSLVNISQKSASKKRNQSPSHNYTVYDEIGSRQPTDHSPTGLSRKELENFRIYS